MEEPPPWAHPVRGAAAPAGRLSCAGVILTASITVVRIRRRSE